jgi:hypothetical protein
MTADGACALHLPRFVGRSEKRAAGAGGSKSKQGGVKQSGQEPLNVQKMDGLVIIMKA